MQALELIQFLTKPKPGRIKAINSPFQQESFPIETAQRWVRAEKASIVDGILIFHEAYRLLILRQFQADETRKREDAAYEAGVDLERSEGKQSSGSYAVWLGKHSGRRPMAGAPENHVMQMTRRFKK